MTNTDKSNEHFMMDPAEQFAVIKEMRAKGLEMLAIYHSHPESPARPSAEDIRLALTPNVSYVIVSLEKANKPVLKSFRTTAGSVEPEEVEYL
jgi:proteasome lid subunit RPN8/RPN11